MRKVRRKSPALVELILVILFFSLSAMVLVQVFVKAKTLSQTGRDGTMGLLFAQDLIEQWKADPSAPEEVFSPEEGWSEEEAPEGTGFVSLRDGDMELISDGAGPSACTAEVLLSEETKEAGTLYRIQVTVTRNYNGELLAGLETAAYVPDSDKEQEAAP